jgi:predicted DNA binding CopG/RHH family protein
MINVNFIKKMRLKRASIIICLIAGFVALFSISYNIGERYYIKRSAENMEKSVFRVTYEQEASFSDEVIIYDAMHRMANSKIAAEDKDKNGSIQITSKQIQAVRTIVNHMNYPDNSYILAVLNRWEKGDFSLVTDEHEYFWSRLK